MSKIAIQLDDKRNIIGYVSENTAESQVKFEGWTLVDNDPTFLVDDMFLWTIRESDNALVHISTGMTPAEESTQANALLGQQVGNALIQSGSASTSAKLANDTANGAMAGLAQLGKLVAPLLAIQTTNAETTIDGGTK